MSDFPNLKQRMSQRPKCPLTQDYYNFSEIFIFVAKNNSQGMISVMIECQRVWLQSVLLGHLQTQKATSEPFWALEGSLCPRCKKKPLLDHFLVTSTENGCSSTACHNSQAPPGYGSGRYGFGVFGAQDSVLRDMCSVGTRHAFFSITFLSI